MIESAAAACGARLLVIDPLMAYLTGVDASRDQDVRRALFRLARLAERLGCAVVCLRHLNKTHGDKAIYRGGGSIGIIGAGAVGSAGGARPRRPAPAPLGDDQEQSGAAVAAAALRPGAPRRRLSGGMAGRGGLRGGRI